ncbi:hypothetical protein IAR55_000289 [Kwoniella newhampshirensis]|uniref:VWFA domain-containing protein n=1 Tax=Kwoniella newhampshirensis TaxID=1651941 RepID=A0AAW0Z687_9TREE
MGFASKLAQANAMAGAAGLMSNRPPGASYGAQGGYGVAQASSPYGAPPSQSAQYAAPTSQPGQYGAPPSQYGQSPAPGQYGQQQSQTPYGAPPVPGGRPTAGGYGQQTSSYGQSGQTPYGQSPQQPPYGQQQSAYGQQSSPYGPQQASYGQQQTPYGQQQTPYGQQPGAPGGYGQQQQYGAAAGAYGQTPGAAPGGGGGVNAQYVTQLLSQCVRDQHLEAFYPPQSLDPIAQRVVQSGALQQLASNWKLPVELASDLVKISLFDVVVLIDDSGSMAFEQNGERIEDLKMILSKIAFACSLFDHDGIQVRFLNSQIQGNNINNEQAALQLVGQVKFSGLTPLGTSLDQKILQPLLLGPARSNALQKPLLIIAITDGAPAGEPSDKIVQVIANAKNELQRSRYGPDAVSYQLSQVGNDKSAQKFLSSLDDHPTVGSLIDQTMDFEYEQEQMKVKTGEDLSPEMWLMKLLLGPIDTSYDSKDETGAAPRPY